MICDDCGNEIDEFGPHDCDAFDLAGKVRAPEPVVFLKPKTWTMRDMQARRLALGQRPEASPLSSAQAALLEALAQGRIPRPSAAQSLTYNTLHKWGWVEGSLASPKVRQSGLRALEAHKSAKLRQKKGEKAPQGR